MSITHPTRRRPRRFGDALGIRVLIVFSTVAVGAGLGRSLVTTYLPVLLERIQDAPGLIGTVMLVNTAAGFAVPLLVGAWSDRLRARGHGRTMPVVLGGTLVAAGGLLAIALGSTSSYLALALFAAVTYVGLNAVTTGHRALIPQTFDDEGRAPATAGEEVAMLVGTLGGVVAGGLLIDAEPWAPFALGALLLPALAVPTVVRMRRLEQPAPQRRTPRPGLPAYREALRRPGAVSVLSAQALWVVGYVGLPPFFILYAERELGMAASRAGLVLAVFGLLTGAAMLAAGLVRPAMQAPALILGAAMMGMGMVLVASSSSLALVAPALVPVAIGYGVLSTLGFPVFSRSIPRGEEGVGSALYFSARALSSAIALPLAGWTIDLTGNYRALFLLGGLATLAAIVPLLRLGGHTRLPPIARIVIARAGLLTSLALALLGAGLVTHHTELVAADRALFEALVGLGGTSRVVDELLVDPHLRNYALLTAVCMLAVASRGAASAWRTGVIVVGAGLAAYAAVRFCWGLWDRPRPEDFLGSAPANDHRWASYPSFPSGHVAVATAMALAGAIATRAWILWPFLWMFVAAVCWTRVTYGAHFPSDVLGGLLIGIASAAAVAVPPDHRLSAPSIRHVTADHPPAPE